MSPKKKIKVNTADDHIHDHDAPELTDEETHIEDLTDELIDNETYVPDEDPLVVQLEEAETRAANYLDSLQRERATFQNYKKRVERERAEQAITITGNLLAKLLPAIDDFHRAMDAVPEGERDQWFEGVTLIQRKLDQLLTHEEVTEIDALGTPFDPNYHEAIGVDADSDAASGTVTQVLQRGYMHKDRVLRPAMVRVAE